MVRTAVSELLPEEIYTALTVICLNFFRPKKTPVINPKDEIIRRLLTSLGDKPSTAYHTTLSNRVFEHYTAYQCRYRTHPDAETDTILQQIERYWDRAATLRLVRTVLQITEISPDNQRVADFLSPILQCKDITLDEVRNESKDSAASDAPPPSTISRQLSPPTGAAPYRLIDINQYGDDLLQWMNTENGRANKSQVMALIDPRPAAAPQNDPKVYQRLEQLQQSSPTLSGFIDTVLHQLHAHQLLQQPQPLRLLPTLLVGEPGIGKTYIVNRVSEALRMDIEAINLSLNREAFAFAGVPRGYSNALPGDVVARMATTKTINPIIVLDELDKASFYPRDVPAITAPLLQALEPETAGHFEDACLRCALDLRHVSWMATANSLDTIPSPILSRFHIIAVEPPSPQMQRLQCHTVLTQVCNMMGVKAPRQVALADETVNAYAGRPFRELAVLLRLAISAKIATHPHRHQLVIFTRDIEPFETRPQQKRRIGFL